MALPGSGTTAGMGVPATISPSGRRAGAAAGRVGAGVPSRRAKGVAWKPPGRDLERGAGLEHVVDAPQLPHALGEVRVEVAVEDGVAGALVPVARAAEVDLVGVAAAGADALGVEVVGVVVVGVEQPLVVVQVEDVVFLAGVQVAELHEVADVAVVHVGGVVRVVGAWWPSGPAAPGSSAPDGAQASRPKLAGMSTSMAGSPTAEEVRKNSS